MNLRTITCDLNAFSNKLIALAEEGKKMSESPVELGEESLALANALSLKERIEFFLKKFDWSRNKLVELQMEEGDACDWWSYLKGDVAAKDADLNVSANDVLLLLNRKISSLEESMNEGQPREEIAREKEDRETWNARNARCGMQVEQLRADEGKRNVWREKFERMFRKQNRTSHAKIDKDTRNYSGIIGVAMKSTSIWCKPWLGFSSNEKEIFREKLDEMAQVELIKMRLREAGSEIEELKRENQRLRRDDNYIAGLREELIIARTSEVEARTVFTASFERLNDQLRRHEDHGNALLKELEKVRARVIELEVVEVKVKELEKDGSVGMKKLKEVETKIKDLEKQQLVAFDSGTEKHICPSLTFLPKCFLDIVANSKPLGIIVIELRSDVVPKTAENFRAMCTGEKGFGYKGSEFHKVFPGAFCQGGNIISADGNGQPIYEKSVEVENYDLKHTGPGTVAMAYPELNNQFYVSVAKTNWLDNRFVVFGVVVSGMTVVRMMEGYGSKEGKTSKKLVIKDCGQLM